jgi:hypothetical protein
MNSSTGQTSHKVAYQIPSISGLLRSPDRSIESSPFITYRGRIASSDRSSSFSRTASPLYHASVTSSSRSRFDCLYSNAIDSRRFHEQIRRQAEKFKEKHAMDGCTFNPRLIARSYTPKQLTPRPREMETMNKVVDRMRRASAIREEQLKYTRLRSGTNAPPKIAKAAFSFGDGRKYDVGARLQEDREKRLKEKLADASSVEDDPAIVIEVAGDDGLALGKLVLRKKDDVRSVVSRFCDNKKLLYEYESRLLKRVKRLAEDESTWPSDRSATKVLPKETDVKALRESSLPPPFDPSLKPPNQ